MVKKIVNITLSQIIMWVLVFLIDRANECDIHTFFQVLFDFILPIVILNGYVLLWISEYSYNKSNSLIKWIIQYVVCLGIWLLETIVFLMIINYFVEKYDDVLYNMKFLSGIIYWFWAGYAVVIPVCSVIMHMTSTLININKKAPTLHFNVNIIFTLVLLISVCYGGIVDVWGFIVAIIFVNMCFIYNYCHKKCIP